jgi:hypothetical protein
MGAVSYGAMLYKSERWTVYKQNPDWRSAAHYLSVQSVPPKEALVLGTIFPVELVHYFPREAQAPYPRVIRYDAKIVEQVLSVNRVRALYLIKNQYWRAGFDRVFQRIKDDKRFVLVNSQFFKGLEIYTIFYSKTGQSTG